MKSIAVFSINFNEYFVNFSFIFEKARKKWEELPVIQSVPTERKEICAKR